MAPFMEDILIYHENLTALTSNDINCSTFNIEMIVAMNRNPIQTAELVTSRTRIVHTKSQFGLRIGNNEVWTSLWF